MRAVDVRAKVAACRLLRKLADDETDRAIASLNPLKPGSIVKHCETGKIGTIKDRQGTTLIDFYENNGPQPLHWSDAVNWDVLQEPEE